MTLALYLTGFQQILHQLENGNDMPAFLALLKARPLDFNYASSGPGTPYHMAGELFKVIALGKGCEADLLGFTEGERSHTL